MWLTSTKVPDHNTINRFRSSRLKDVLKTVFATIVTFLVAEGFVSWTWPAPTERRWRQTPTVIRSSGASLSTSASPESRNSLRRYGGTPSPSPSRSCVTPLQSLTRTSPPRRWKGHWSRYMRLWRERMRTGK
ncbi:transposase [Prevotella sp.]|uniref:transposase n=1 Tax=Prevotella sp. TaxID=59823 RepID=UPI003AB7344D